MISIHVCTRKRVVDSIDYSQPIRYIVDEDVIPVPDTLSCAWGCSWILYSFYLFLSPIPTSPYTTLDYSKENLLPLTSTSIHLYIPMHFSTVCLALVIFTV